MNTIILSMSNGQFLTFNRLTLSELHALKDIVDMDQLRDCYHHFSYTDESYWIRPNDVTFYIIKDS